MPSNRTKPLATLLRNVPLLWQHTTKAYYRIFLFEESRQLLDIFNFSSDSILKRKYGIYHFPSHPAKHTENMKDSGNINIILPVPLLASCLVIHAWSSGITARSNGFLYRLSALLLLFRATIAFLFFNSFLLHFSFSTRYIIFFIHFSFTLSRSCYVL